MQGTAFYMVNSDECSHITDELLKIQFQIFCLNQKNQFIRTLVTAAVYEGALLTMDLVAMQGVGGEGVTVLIDATVECIYGFGLVEIQQLFPNGIGGVAVCLQG